jgi:hypothetical protein
MCKNLLNAVRVVQSLVFCVVFCISLFFLVFYWPLFCLFSFDSHLLIASFGHCFVCSPLIHTFWLPLLAIVLSVFLRFTASDYLFWPLFCLFSFDSQLLIASFGHCFVCSPLIHTFWLPLLAIILSVFLRFTASDCLFWPLFCLFSFDSHLLIASFGHYFVCSPSIHSFWLPLLAIVLSVLLRFTASDCLVWPLLCVFSFDLQLLIAYFDHCFVCFPSFHVTYRK